MEICNESYWVRGFLRQMHFAKRTPHPFLPRGTTVMPSPNASRACPTCARECETRASPGFVGEGATMHAGHAHDIRPPQQRRRPSVQPEQRGSGRRLRSPRSLVGARVGQSQTVRLRRAASFRSIQTGRRSGARPATPTSPPCPSRPIISPSSRPAETTRAAPARWRSGRRAQRHRLCRKFRRRRQRGGTRTRHAVAQRHRGNRHRRGRPELHGRGERRVEILHRARRDPAGACAWPGRRRGAERRDGHLAQPRHQRSRAEDRLSRVLR